jgi:hypothetical protein
MREKKGFIAFNRLTSLLAILYPRPQNLMHNYPAALMGTG